MKVVQKNLLAPLAIALILVACGEGGHREKISVSDHSKNRKKVTAEIDAITKSFKTTDGKSYKCKSLPQIFKNIKSKGQQNAQFYTTDLSISGYLNNSKSLQNLSLNQILIEDTDAIVLQSQHNNTDPLSDFIQEFIYGGKFTSEEKNCNINIKMSDGSTQVLQAISSNSTGLQELQYQGDDRSLFVTYLPSKNRVTFKVLRSNIQGKTCTVEDVISSTTITYNLDWGDNTQFVSLSPNFATALQTQILNPHLGLKTSLTTYKEDLAANPRKSNEIRVEVSVNTFEIITQAYENYLSALSGETIAANKPMIKAPTCSNTNQNDQTDPPTEPTPVKDEPVD